MCYILWDWKVRERAHTELKDTGGFQKLKRLQKHILPSTSRRSATLPTPWSWTSELQRCRAINLGQCLAAAVGSKYSGGTHGDGKAPAEGSKAGNAPAWACAPEPTVYPFLPSCLLMQPGIQGFGTHVRCRKQSRHCAGHTPLPSSICRDFCNGRSERK